MTLPEFITIQISFTWIYAHKNRRELEKQNNGIFCPLSSAVFLFTPGVCLVLLNYLNGLSKWNPFGFLMKAFIRSL